MLRLKRRNQLSDSEAVQRIDSQMPSAQKCKLADYVVNNDGDLDTFYAQLDAILHRERPSLLATFIYGGLFIPFALIYFILSWIFRR